MGEDVLSNCAPEEASDVQRALMAAVDPLTPRTSVDNWMQAAEAAMADSAPFEAPTRREMLLRQAARAWDAGDDEAPELARLAKSHITHEVVSMARSCVEMMGAFGFTWEGGDHIWLKRAMFDSLQGGAPLQMRRELAALRGWNDPVQDRTLTRMWRRKL